MTTTIRDVPGDVPAGFSREFEERRKAAKGRHDLYVHEQAGSVHDKVAEVFDPTLSKWLLLAAVMLFIATLVILNGVIDEPVFEPIGLSKTMTLAFVLGVEATIAVVLHFVGHAGYGLRHPPALGRSKVQNRTAACAISVLGGAAVVAALVIALRRAHDQRVETEGLAHLIASVGTPVFIVVGLMLCVVAGLAGWIHARINARPRPADVDPTRPVADRARRAVCTAYTDAFGRIVRHHDHEESRLARWLADVEREYHVRLSPQHYNPTIPRGAEATDQLLQMVADYSAWKQLPAGETQRMLSAYGRPADREPMPPALGSDGTAEPDDFDEG